MKLNYFTKVGKLEFKHGLYTFKKANISENKISNAAELFFLTTIVMVVCIF